MNTAPSRPRSRRIGLVPEIVHNCYFALVWSAYRLRRHTDRFFIVLFLRHGKHSLVIRRLGEVRRLLLLWWHLDIKSAFP